MEIPESFPEATGLVELARNSLYLSAGRGPHSPVPHPDDDLAIGPDISLGCHPKESGDAPRILDLPGNTSVDEKNADAPGNDNAKNDVALEED